MNEEEFIVALREADPHPSTDVVIPAFTIDRPMRRSRSEVSWVVVSLSAILGLSAGWGVGQASTRSHQLPNAGCVIIGSRVAGPVNAPCVSNQKM